MTRGTLRKLTCGVMALLVALALPVQALAEEYDLNVGSVTVTADDSGRYVQQANNTTINNSDNGGKGHKETTATVITSKPTDDCTQKAEGTNHSNTITIKTEGKAKAEVTIKDVNISTDRGSGIDVQGSSKAEITVEGANTVTTKSSTDAVVHVGSGELTITGGEGSSLTASTNNEGAGIGSDVGENMSGSITIGGSVDVSASGTFGAGIGSGWGGDMSGGITIRDEATVKNASSYSGAGIGAGRVYESYSEGRREGGTMSGQIVIQDKAVVEKASSTLGAGIGTGKEGDMTGSITIQDHAAVENASGNGVSIGAGDRGTFGEDASIAIKGNSSVNTGNGGVIGAKDPNKSKGTLEIDSTVTLNGKKVAANVIPEPDAKPEEHNKPVYWVTDENGNGAASKVSRKDSVMTVTAELENASFVTTQWGLSELGKQGVKTITFVTSGTTSSFDVGEALENLDSGNLVLTHGGSGANLTLGGVEHNELLK